MALRNWMFDHGHLHSEHFALPVICVGNLAVGGTGKTPHTEYLLRLAKTEGWRCGMLSRGYGRCTQGYIDGAGKSAKEIGDEPYQIGKSCPWAKVSVCEKRPLGIQRMMQGKDAPDVIVLDDAYQHRYVQPGLSILLTDYSHLYYDDYVLPVGRLRESKSGAKRADIIIVTKCPKDMSTKRREEIINRLDPLPHQRVFFTTIKYGSLTPYSPDKQAGYDTHRYTLPTEQISGKRVLVLSGIARPRPLLQHLSAQGAEIESLAFADHHQFSESEISRIARQAAEYPIVVTTAKDAARLSEYHLPEDLRRKMYIQPIEIDFLFNETNLFNQIIKEYVTENSRNSGMD